VDELATIPRTRTRRYPWRALNAWRAVVAWLQGEWS
jgi:hypothetical protein